MPIGKRKRLKEHQERSAFPNLQEYWEHKQKPVADLTPSAALSNRIHTFRYPSSSSNIRNWVSVKAPVSSQEPKHAGETSPKFSDGK
ncbi:9215_t:CDS:2, partial [Paraglomus brasilianum]